MTEARSPAGAESRPQGPDSPASNRAWYLYGITLSAGFDTEALGGGPSPLQERSPVELVTAGDLAAVVRPVSPEEFTPEALAQAAADAGRLESMVLDHNAVIAAVQEERPILPAKFGAVYAGRDDLTAALAASSDALLSQLERLKGTDEWAVHVYVRRPAIEQHAAARDPALRALDGEIAAARPGRAYFLQRKRADVLAAGIGRASAELGAEVYERLAPQAVAGQIGSRSAAERGVDEIEVLRAAFLVERAHVDDFLRAVVSLPAERPEMRADYSGPWPAYSFVTPLEDTRS